MIPEATLSAITGKPLNANARAVLAGLNARPSGLDRPHRLAQYLAQLLHESGAFRYDQEVWGPTPAQERYDTRTDLGNTPAIDGDGKKFKGYTAAQITGKYNTTNFRNWCRAQGMNAPDFVADPTRMLTDPWEGLGPIWYWEAGNPTGASLNVYADRGDIEMITRRVNGGLNGYADRLGWYTRAALVLLGYDRSDVRGFQRDAGLKVDGIDGPQTRAALHVALTKAPAIQLRGNPVITPPLSPTPVAASPAQDPAVKGWAAIIASLAAAIARLFGK